MTWWLFWFHLMTHLVKVVFSWFFRVELYGIKIIIPTWAPKKDLPTAESWSTKCHQICLTLGRFAKKMSSDAKSVVFMALFLAKYNIYHLINLEFLRTFLVPDENLCSRHFNEIVEDLNYCVCVSEGWPSRN